MGTVYCLHHEKEELVGSEPVPCPFCGFGAKEADPARDEIEALGIEDSSDALQHALMSSDARGSGRQAPENGSLRGYW